jgi:hypothetical protein
MKRYLKTITVLLYLLILPSSLLGQRHYERYKGDLPNFDDTGKLLLVGLVLIVIGRLLIINSGTKMGQIHFCHSRVCLYLLVDYFANYLL